MSNCWIVTGASRGIGAAVVRRASAQSRNLVITARSAQALKELVLDLNLDSTRIATVPGDLTDPAVSQLLVDTAMEQFGGIEVLVNNAGILEPIGPLGDVDAEDWISNLMINVASPMRLTQAALNPLRQSRGRVINISSGAATATIPGWSAYCTAKAALNHFNRMLATEYPEIVAIAFSPGMTDTAMQRAIREAGTDQMPDERRERFLEAHRRGELHTPEEVAAAIVALGLRADPSLSGEFVALNDPRVTALI